ncbi:MAG: hypothetical protein GEU90_10510 [Gemmatimonas sp.]|nr:hypothetical protein [Gemmatimonas sp.]
MRRASTGRVLKARSSTFRSPIRHSQPPIRHSRAPNRHSWSPNRHSWSPNRHSRAGGNPAQGSRRSNWWARGLICSAAVGLYIGFLAPQRAVGQGVPPDATWLTFDTQHFRVSYTEGLERVARRAAERGERAHRLLTEEFVPPPEGRIELLVSDNVDLSNGNASPFPRNRIVVFAQPPASEASLTFHDDWLELLMLHELVHIFHFEHAGGVWPPLRRVFGRDPFLFPQIFSPGWVVEGLGTYFESEYTESGRVRGSFFDMILRTAILEDAFFEIDEATFDPVVWPSGSTRYVYGALFVDHLAKRYGRARVTDFVKAFGRQLIPYRIEAASRSAFGTTLSREWTAWQDSLRAEAATLVAAASRQGITAPEIVTAEGRIARHPRFSPDGSRIAYAASTGRDDAAIRILEPDGSTSTAVERSSTGPPSWVDGDAILYGQLDFDGPYRLYSDLHVARRGGRGREVTGDARVWEADSHPDGRSAIAVASAQGTNILVQVDLETGAVAPVTDQDLDTYWSGPRWSPDGDRIAASRWSAGGLYDVVVLDPAGKVVREVTRDRAVDSDPTWSSDGRFLLFSSDRTGIRNLFAYELASGRLWQVTNVLTGASEPDVSPDGATIVFSYYRSDGFHIATIPFDPASWWEARPPEQGEGLASPNAEAQLDAEAGGPIRPYSSWPTVAPTHWAIALSADADVGFGAGIGLSGVDVIQRHLWAFDVLGYPEGPRFDAGFGYRYRGWGNPVLGIAAAQEWGVQAESAGPESELPSDVLRQERYVEGVLSWVLPSWRSRVFLETGLDLRKLGLSWREPELVDGTSLREFPLDLGARAGIGYSSVRGYALSLGPQEGVFVSTSLEARRFLETPEWDPSSRDYWQTTLRGRAFQALDWYGFASPVLAIRVDASVVSESATPGFSLGGASGADIGLGNLDTGGSDIDFPVRGFPSGVQWGNRVLSGSVEYRFPIALVERGFRLLPLAFDRLWGDVFLDSGTAWCSTPCAIASEIAPTDPDPLLSVGIEGILGLRLGYFSNLPLRAGVALPVRSGASRSASFYLRLGPSF